MLEGRPFIQTVFVCMQALVKFGLSSSTRLARLALVRMLTRMCGVGGGTPPELGPLVRSCADQHEQSCVVFWGVAG